MVIAIVVFPTHSTIIMALLPMISFLHYLCLLTLIASAAATTQPVSSSITLQPSSSTSNSSDPCDFPDRSSLVARIKSEQQSYNTSLLVQTCPGVCPLVYGSGNPDISGIGVILELCQRENLKAENNKGHDILFNASHLSYLIWTYSRRHHHKVQAQRWQIVGPVLHNLQSCDRRCTYDCQDESLRFLFGRYS